MRQHAGKGMRRGGWRTLLQRIQDRSLALVSTVLIFLRGCKSVGWEGVAGRRRGTDTRGRTV